MRPPLFLCVIFALAGCGQSSGTPEQAGGSPATGQAGSAIGGGNSAGAIGAAGAANSGGATGMAGASGAAAQSGSSNAGGADGGRGGMSGSAGTPGSGGKSGSAGAGGNGGATTSSGPCDVYSSGSTPCIAAHSTVRALSGSYSGMLYQVRRASDKTTKDISVLTAGGFADAAAQDTFCANTTCTI